MKELTDEQLKILAQLEQKQAERDAIPESQKIPISNPDKYTFPIGIPDIVTLCPYCLGIIDEQELTCLACNRNIKNDAPIEMTVAEYNNARQVDCPFCKKSKLGLAKVCPSCGK